MSLVRSAEVNTVEGDVEQTRANIAGYEELIRVLAADGDHSPALIAYLESVLQTHRATLLQAERERRP